MSWFPFLIISLRPDEPRGRASMPLAVVQLRIPGCKRLRTFVEEFKKDFDCLQPQSQASYRQHQYSIYLAALNDNNDQLEGSSANVEHPLTLTTSTASISNPTIVSSQPSKLLSPLSTVFWMTYFEHFSRSSCSRQPPFCRRPFKFHHLFCRRHFSCYWWCCRLVHCSRYLTPWHSAILSAWLC